MGCNSYRVDYCLLFDEQEPTKTGLIASLSMESDVTGCLCSFPNADIHGNILPISKERLYALALLGAAVVQVYRVRPPQSLEDIESGGVDLSTSAFVPRPIREAIGQAVGISVSHEVDL